MTGDYVVALRCDPTHVFHYECIEEWLTEADTCPLCRTVLRGKAHENSSEVFVYIVVERSDVGD